MHNIYLMIININCSEITKMDLTYLTITIIQKVMILPFEAHCTSPPKCQNEGYVSVECKCTCPVGFTGTTCDTILTDPG